MAKPKTTTQYGSMTLNVEPGRGPQVIAQGRLARQKEAVYRLVAVPTELDEAISKIECGGPRNVLMVALLALGLEQIEETKAKVGVVFAEA